MEKDLYGTRKAQQESLDEAVYKWYIQERAKGVTVNGLDMQHAAERLAEHLDLKKFKCSAGWL